MLLRTRAPAPRILLSADSAPVTDSIPTYRFPAKRSTKAPAQISSMLAFAENNAHHARFLTHNSASAEVGWSRDLATRAGIPSGSGPSIARGSGDAWMPHLRVHTRKCGIHALVSSSFELRRPLDLTALVLASRRSDELWFCPEQPDHDAFGLAALGAVRTLEASGRNRFARLLLSLNPPNSGVV